MIVTITNFLYLSALFCMIVLVWRDAMVPKAKSTWNNETMLLWATLMLVCIAELLERVK